MSLIDREIPYSEIIKYLTNIQKRNFQSMNKTSKRLLLAGIGRLIFSSNIQFMDSYLQWITNNSIYLTGVVEIIIEGINDYEQFADIIRALNHLNLKNIKKIRIVFLKNIINLFDLVKFFKKVVNTRILEISSNVFKHILDIYEFKFIQTLNIYGSILEITNLKKFNSFLENNNLSYLEEVSFQNINTVILSIVFKNIVRHGIRKINLFDANIDSISDDIKIFLTSNMMKKIRRVGFYSEEEGINYQFVNYFFTPYVKYISCDLITDECLKRIGDQCKSLIELNIPNSVYTQAGFEYFLRTNKLGHLIRFTGNVNYLLRQNINNFLPNLKSISIDPLDTDQSTDKFLFAVKGLQSIEFSSNANYNDIIPRFQEFKNLTSLDIINDEISLVQFILLMNVLDLTRIKTFGAQISSCSFETIAPFFNKLTSLEEIHVVFNTVDLNRIMIELQIMGFLDIISRLDIKNKNLRVINLIANKNNSRIMIPNHAERFLELWKKFPKLESVQLGWGIFTGGP